MNYVESCMNNIQVINEELHKQLRELVEHLASTKKYDNRKLTAMHEEMEEFGELSISDFLDSIEAMMKEEERCSTGEPSASVAESGPSDELRGGLDV